MNGGIKTFVPTNKQSLFPLGGSTNRRVTQIELYEKLTDKNCDLRDIAAVVEPVIITAQMEPTDLYGVITNASIPLLS